MDQPEWIDYLNQFEKLDASYFSKIPKNTKRIHNLVSTKIEKMYFYFLIDPGKD